jgi:Family of unknown function (DUF6186)
MTAGATYAAYALVAVMAVAWQVTCVRRDSLTFGKLVAWLRGNRVVRILLLLGWAWLGWHLFVRGTASFLH